VTPLDSRRDDLRFNLRAKISQKNYIDKDMKAFHYNQEIIGGGSAHNNLNKVPTYKSTGMDKIISESEKLEFLKKQINQLKR
jgi:hypothetical protein